MRAILCAFCLILAVNAASASVYLLPPEKSRVIGENIEHQVLPGDYFQALSEYYDVGLLALIAANPDVDPFLPRVGSKLIIPKKMLLPFAERKGIVINLAELRLYYFPPNEPLVYVFPVGIGREGLSTPKVVSVIGDKRKNPTWRPPQALRERYKAEFGVELAKEVPAGPNNPFGKYALRIGTSEYLIHGTNKRLGIGLRASSGCIRLYDDDIKWLFENVAVGTQVRIIDQPIKMSYENDGRKLFEVHKPLSDTPVNVRTQLAKTVQRFLGEKSDTKAIQRILEEQKGLVYQVQ